ncbi:MAG TPA: LuxR C-terminal-related transcriptional regulator [Candidatus Limnocylindrales bacterium]|nr:LuxR C-terminal-related transcriptional regulator [Candidatus Limnocylindrales bacterium]
MPTVTMERAGVGRDMRSASAGLLSTKLRVPSSAPGHVPRRRLVERLDAALDRGIVLVTAPAGSGKTTLLAEWADGLCRPAAWLAIDEADDEPDRFWRYVRAALRDGPTSDESDAPTRIDGTEVARTDAADQTPGAEALINEIAAGPDDVILVLDGYDRIHDESIHDGMATLMDRRPDNLRLVLASRGEPPLPIARLRASGHLFDLTCADLRMRDDEVAAVVREERLSLSAEDVRLLSARTEGWAAGVRLACLSLQGEAGRCMDGHCDVAARLGRRARFILDFLVEEVLGREAPETRAFLRATSIVDRISGDLANALTGRTDGQAMLERLERRNLFLVPLDDHAGWWRYHGLFGELLRSRLLALQPDDVPRLHRAAAAWYADRGQTGDAIRHALDAGDAPDPRRVLIPGSCEALSERELEVLRLLAAGHANREIADRLFVTVDTVKRHVTHILGKLGAANRTEAAARSRDLGLLD